LGEVSSAPADAAISRVAKISHTNMPPDREYSALRQRCNHERRCLENQNGERSTKYLAHKEPGT
jgi:hypothetical protein